MINLIANEHLGGDDGLGLLPIVGASIASAVASGKKDALSQLTKDPMKAIKSIFGGGGDTYTKPDPIKASPITSPMQVSPEVYNAALALVRDKHDPGIYRAFGLDPSNSVQRGRTLTSKTGHRPEDWMAAAQAGLLIPTQGITGANPVPASAPIASQPAGAASPIAAPSSGGGLLPVAVGVGLLAAKLLGL